MHADYDVHEKPEFVTVAAWKRTFLILLACTFVTLLELFSFTNKISLNRGSNILDLASFN